jgi:hypothetical protein
MGTLDLKKGQSCVSVYIYVQTVRRSLGFLDIQIAGQGTS